MSRIPCSAIADRARGVVAARYAVIGTVLLISAAAAAEPPPPQAPRLVAPPDDPERTHCLTPDPERGFTLSWAVETNPYPVSTYIEVRRKLGNTGEWRPWVKKYARPPFTLGATNPLAYDAVFAWRVWAVDPSGKAEPYAVPSDWWVFCTTRPRAGRHE